MQTVFDHVQMDFLLIAMVENTFTLGCLAVSQFFDGVGEPLAKIMSLISYFVACAALIHFITACLTRVACIWLFDTIELIKGKLSKPGPCLKMC